MNKRQRTAVWAAAAAAAWAAFGVAASSSFGANQTYAYSITVIDGPTVIALPEPPDYPLVRIELELRPRFNAEAVVDLQSDGEAWRGPEFIGASLIVGTLRIEQGAEEYARAYSGAEFDLQAPGVILEPDPEPDCDQAGADSYRWPAFQFVAVDEQLARITDPGDLSQFRRHAPEARLWSTSSTGVPEGAPKHCAEWADLFWTGEIAFRYVFPTCTGDVDGDGDVDIGDYKRLLDRWGPCLGECPMDLDGDNQVGADDLVELLFRIGRPCVPESDQWDPVDFDVLPWWEG